VGLVFYACDEYFDVDDLASACRYNRRQGEVGTTRAGLCSVLNELIRFTRSKGQSQVPTLATFSLVEGARVG
jgi:hypothetical protein